MAALPAVNLSTACLCSPSPSSIVCFHCLRAPLARDVPPARIHGHLDPEERACDLDVIDRKLDIAGRSSFDPDAEPWNSRLQLTQLLGRIGLRLLLSVANPEIIRRKLDSLPIQLGCHDQRTALD